MASKQPLGIVVVADHSEGMDFFSMFATGDPHMMNLKEGCRMTTRERAYTSPIWYAP